MPLRPFPLPISIGTDICSINRIRAILSKGDDNLKRCLRRFLTPREQTEVLRRYGSADLADPKALGILSHFLAGRWAAKEATIKAVTWRKLSFHDIIIRNPQTGRGHVHAVILDDVVCNESGTKDASIALDANHDSWKPRDNGPSDESNHDSEALSSQVSLNAASEKGHRPRPATAPLEDEYTRSTEDQPPSSDGSGDLSGQIAQISISHDSGYATAVCLAVQEPVGGDVGGKLAARNV